MPAPERNADLEILMDLLSQPLSGGAHLYGTSPGPGWPLEAVEALTQYEEAGLSDRIDIPTEDLTDMELIDQLIEDSQLRRGELERDLADMAGLLDVKEREQVAREIEQAKGNRLTRQMEEIERAETERMRGMDPGDALSELVERKRNLEAQQQRDLYESQGFPTSTYTNPNTGKIHVLKGDPGWASPGGRRAGARQLRHERGRGQEDVGRYGTPSPGSLGGKRRIDMEYFSHVMEEWREGVRLMEKDPETGNMVWKGRYSVDPKDGPPPIWEDVFPTKTDQEVETVVGKEADESTTDSVAEETYQRTRIAPSPTEAPSEAVTPEVPEIDPSPQQLGFGEEGLVDPSFDMMDTTGTEDDPSGLTYLGGWKEGKEAAEIEAVEEGDISAKPPWAGGFQEPSDLIFDPMEAVTTPETTTVDELYLQPPDEEEDKKKATTWKLPAGTPGAIYASTPNYSALGSVSADIKGVNDAGARHVARATTGRGWTTWSDAPRIADSQMTTLKSFLPNDYVNQFLS